jgi:hypothetical protein
VRGDQVEMLNGDRYVGQVLSLGSDTLVVQSEVLGTLRLPRTRISTITLDSSATGTVTNIARPGPVTPRAKSVARVATTNSTSLAPGFAATIRQLGANTNVIQQVQQQFLADAGPEAQTKFNDLVGGLLSGKIGVNELRTQAKTTLDQARSVRKDLGEEGGSMMDSYLTILESFLKETDTAATSTNTPVLTARPTLPQSAETE